MRQGADGIGVGRGVGSKTRVPTPIVFVSSSFFHYLGPSFAVILFAYVPVLGVAWLRIASAAGVYAVWRRPWRSIKHWKSSDLGELVALGAIFAAMNSFFYLALAGIPLATVGAIEFLAPVAIAAFGVRTGRNLLALLAASAGAYLLSVVELGQQPEALAFAFANCALFGGYILLGHRAAQQGASSGINRVGTSMLFALVFITPVGLFPASISFFQPMLLAAGVGVGVCSSVVAYVLDQIAMSRLPRATFALMLSILPAMATVIGALVLRQFPTVQQLFGIAFIMAGVAAHQPAWGDA